MASLVEGVMGYQNGSGPVDLRQGSRKVEDVAAEKDLSRRP